MIVVNATALRAGGALSILSQFIDSINGMDEYLIFIHPSVDFDIKNKLITLKKIDKASFLSRIVWDSYGLNAYLKKEGIIATTVISLQNTSVKVPLSCVQIIYLHNIIPFSNYKWSFSKREDLRLLLYKYIYSFFIFLHASTNSYFIVQSEWFKKLLTKRGVRKENIIVARPEVKLDNINNAYLLNLDKNDYSIFYPATSLGYKNHIEIVNAFIYMKLSGLNYNNIKVYFTFILDKDSELYDLLEKHQLLNNFYFLGALSFNHVLSYYKSVDLIVFPSRLETFGLPLIEAATLGKNIIAIDLVYAREALQTYQGVTFCQYGNSKDWAEKIQLRTKKKNIGLIAEPNEGWFQVQQLIDKLKED